MLEYVEWIENCPFRHVLASTAGQIHLQISGIISGQLSKNAVFLSFLI